MKISALGGKILLTGATGFIGSSVLSCLVELGYDLIILKRSFSDTSRISDIIEKVAVYNIDERGLNEVFEENKIKGIVHLATDYGRTNQNDPAPMMEANIIYPTKLLDLGVKNDISFFVNTHSYADSKYSLYASMKNAFLEICNYYAANHEIKFLNLSLEYVYGEDDDDTKFITFLIESILRESEIKASSCEQERDFVHVADVAAAYGKTITNIDIFPCGFSELEIGTGKSTSIKVFIENIEKIANRKAKVTYGAVPYRKNEIFCSKADIKKTEELLDWHPEFDIQKGLTRTIEWYNNNIKSS